jgi:hypothetical protein
VEEYTLTCVTRSTVGAAPAARVSPAAALVGRSPPPMRADLRPPGEPPDGSVTANALDSNADFAPGRAVMPDGDVKVRSYHPAGDAAVRALSPALRGNASSVRSCAVDAR